MTIRTQRCEVISHLGMGLSQRPGSAAMARWTAFGRGLIALECFCYKLA
jgi:hypothetical protein